MLFWETPPGSRKATQIISQFDFATVQELTRIYGLQEIIMQGSVNKFSDVYFDRASQEAANLQTTLLQLELVMNEIVGQEHSLIYLLNQATKQHEEGKKP